MTHGIEWLNRPGTKGESWNPITGCTPISEGCQHCYARRMAKRLAGRCGYPEAPHEFDVTLHPDKLKEPLRWRKPRTVFLCSMSDLFHEDVPYEPVAQIFGVMALARQHTFIVLTKRPERMKECMDLLDDNGEMWYWRDWAAHKFGAPDWLSGGGYQEDEHPGNPAFIERLPLEFRPEPEWPLPNVWGLVTAENQERADERIPWLFEAPFAVRGVSVEPMLGPVHLGKHLPGYRWEAVGDGPDVVGAEAVWDERGLDWVICGAETGPAARPMDLAWARDLRDQCKAAGVPYFFKRPSPGTETPPDLMVREWPRNGEGR